jgi:hypothetical protein
MDCPCNGCNERVLGCHSNCPKEPSYDDWKQWMGERAEVHRATVNDHRAYLHSLERTHNAKRRKR